MALERSREEDGGIKALTMKLKRLKRTKEDVDFSKLSRLLSCMEKPAVRTFKCKTCDREFDSFQALGGHRASHSAKSDYPLKNQKIHVCKECGAEFAKGQALGGHMRKHRDMSPSPSPSPTASEEEMSSDLTPRVDSKESSSSKRVRSLDIDLNLVPSDQESDEEDYQPLEDSKLKNYDVDENNSKLNHDEESEEEDYSKPLEEENYPTENYSKLKNFKLDENNSKLKHDDLPLKEEEKLNIEC